MHFYVATVKLIVYIYIRIYTDSTSQGLCLHSMFCRVLFRYGTGQFAHILQGYFTGTGAIIWLPQCQWCNPETYGYSTNKLWRSFKNNNITMRKPWSYSMGYTIIQSTRCTHMEWKCETNCFIVTTSIKIWKLRMLSRILGAITLVTVKYGDDIWAV